MGPVPATRSMSCARALLRKVTEEQVKSQASGFFKESAPPRILFKDSMLEIPSRELGVHAEQ